MFTGVFAFVCIVSWLISTGCLGTPVVRGRVNRRLLGGRGVVRTSVSLSLLFLAAQVAPGAASALVLPPGDDLPAGDVVNAFPIGGTTPGRYQQVYSGASFPDAPQILISAISFRTDRVTQDRVPEQFEGFVQDIDFLLSTTSAGADELSRRYAENSGVDESLVFSGFLPLGILGPGAPENPSAFHVNVPFDELFLFDPAAGNLLVEVRNRTGTNLPFGNAIFFDAVDSGADGTSRVFEFFDGEGAQVEVGQIDSLGLVTRFHFTVVPEPSPGLLVAIGILVVATGRRLERRCA